MKSNGGERANYVHKVREGTQKYIRDLLKENERLRLVVANLEGDNRRLGEQLQTLREQVEGHQSQAANLQAQLSNIEAENRRFSEQYVEVEQSNTNLANLYVASYRLHSTLDREAVLATIREIIINLIGSEELGIFELDPRGSELQLVSHFGIDPECYESVALGSGVIGHAAISGETYLSGNGNGNGNGRLPNEANLTSCIPLKVDSRVVGAIAIFRLLQHKAGLEAVDHELFHLLATHAAVALYCTRA